MAVQDFNNPYEINWNTDDYGNPVSALIQNETHTITDNMIVLAQIPDELHKVQITGKYEVNINAALSSADYFKVDYKSGFVYFYSTLEGSSITIAQYYGRGVRRIIASRVQLVDEDGYYGVNNTGEKAFKIMHERVNNIVSNNPQPSEVVDARYNSVSATPTTYDTLKERIDTEYTEVMNKIGNLSSLSTTDKESLVSATNEIKTELTSHWADNIQQFADIEANKADKTEINELATNKADKTEVNSLATNKAEISYVDAQIASIASGAPKGTYATLTDLQTAYPTGDTGNYIVAADGHIYNWNGSAWTDTGILYQSAGYANGSIRHEKLVENIKSILPSSLYSTDFVVGAVNGSTGANISSTTRCRTSTKKLFKKNTQIYINSPYSELLYLSVLMYSTDGNLTFWGGSSFDWNTHITLRKDAYVTIAVAYQDGRDMSADDFVILSEAVKIIETKNDNYVSTNDKKIGLYLGTILSNGNNSVGDTRCRTDYLKFNGNKLGVSSVNYQYYIHYYEDDLTYIGNSGAWLTGDTVIEYIGYIRLAIAKLDNATVVADDLSTISDGVTFKYGYVGIDDLSFDVDNLSTLKNPLFIPKKPRFVCHRGLSAVAPENTIPAFELAGQGGAWGIEVDVLETSDGAFVCIHDDTVDAMTDGTGNVRDFTLAQLQAMTIDAGNGIGNYSNLKIPTLQEYLEICLEYGCVPVIEIKGITNYANLINIAKEYNLEYSCIMTGTLAVAKAFRKYNTSIPIAIAGYYTSDYTTLIPSCAAIYNSMVLAQVSANLTDDVLKSIHAYSMQSALWTCDDMETAKTWFKKGAGIIYSNSIAQLS